MPYPSRDPAAGYTGGTPTAAYEPDTQIIREEDYTAADVAAGQKQKYQDTAARAAEYRKYAALGQVTPQQAAARPSRLGSSWLINYNLQQAEKLDLEWNRVSAKVDPKKNPVIHDIVVEANKNGAMLNDQDIANLVSVGDHERALHAYSDFINKGDMIGARNMIMELQQTNPILASMVPASFEKDAGRWVSENGGKWVLDQARDPNAIQNALGWAGSVLTSDSNWNPIHDLTLLWEGGQHALAASKVGDQQETVAGTFTNPLTYIPVLGPVLKGWDATEKGSLDPKRLEEIKVTYPTAVVDAALKLRQGYADGNPDVMVDMLMDENLDPQVAAFLRDTLYPGKETATMMGKDGKEVPLGSRDLMEQVLGARTDNIGDVITTDFLQAWNNDSKTSNGYGSPIRGAISSGANLAASFIDPTIMLTGAGRLVIASRYAIAKLAPKISAGATAAERAAAHGDIAHALRSVKIAGFETNRARRYMEGFLRGADKLDDLEKGSVEYGLAREHLARQYRLIPDDVAETFINGTSKTSVGRQVDGIIVDGERVSTGLVDVIADQNELWVALSKGISNKAADQGKNYLMNKAVALELLDDIGEDIVPLEKLKTMSTEQIEELYAKKLPEFKARAEAAAAKAADAGEYSEKASELGAAAEKAAKDYADVRDAVGKAQTMEEAIVGRELTAPISERLTSRTQSRDLLMPRTGVIGDLRRRAVNGIFTSSMGAKRAEALVDVYLNGATTPEAVAHAVEQNYDKFGRDQRTLRGEGVLPGRAGVIGDRVTRLGSTMPNKLAINIATASDADTFYKFAREFHSRPVAALLTDAFRRGGEGTRRDLIAATIRSGAAARGVNLSKEEIATKLDELATGRMKGEAYAMETPGAPSAIMMESTRREAEKADRLVTKSQGVIDKRNATIEKAQAALEEAMAKGNVAGVEAAQKRIDNAMESIAKHEAKIAKQQIHFDRLENALLLSLGKKESRRPSAVLNDVPVAAQEAPPVKVVQPVDLHSAIIEEASEYADELGVSLESLTNETELATALYNRRAEKLLAENPKFGEGEFAPVRKLDNGKWYIDIEKDEVLSAYTKLFYPDLTDESVVSIYRGIREGEVPMRAAGVGSFTGDKFISGSVSWWTYNPAVAAAYAQRSGQVAKLDITFGELKSINTSAARGFLGPQAHDQFGMSEEIFLDYTKVPDKYKDAVEIVTPFDIGDGKGNALSLLRRNKKGSVESAPVSLSAPDSKPLTVGGSPVQHLGTGRPDVPNDGTIEIPEGDGGNWTSTTKGGYSTTIKSGKVDRDVKVEIIETREGGREWKVTVGLDPNVQYDLDASATFNEWGDLAGTVWDGPDKTQYGYKKKNYVIVAKAIAQEAEKYDIPIRGRLSDWLTMMGVKHKVDDPIWDARIAERSLSPEQTEDIAKWMLEQDPRLGDVYRYPDGDRAFPADVYPSSPNGNRGSSTGPSLNTRNPRVRELLAVYLGVADGYAGKAATPELRAAHEAANRLATIPDLNARVAAHPGVNDLMQEFDAALKKGDKYSASILEDQIAIARRDALADLADEVMSDPTHRQQFLASYGLDGDVPNEEWLDKLVADYESAGENFRFAYGEAEPFTKLKTIADIEDSNPAIARAIEAGDYDAAMLADEEVKRGLRDQVMGNDDVWSAFNRQQNGRWRDIQAAREEEFTNDWMMGGGAPEIDPKYAAINNQGLAAVMNPPLPESAMKLWNEEGKISRVAMHDLIEEWGDEQAWSWFNTGHPDASGLPAFNDEPFSAIPKMRPDPGTGLPNARKAARVPGEYRQFDVGAPEPKGGAGTRKTAALKKLEQKLDEAVEMEDQDLIEEIEAKIFEEKSKKLATPKAKPKKATGEYLQPPWWHKPLSKSDYIQDRTKKEMDRLSYELEQGVEAGMLDTEIDNFVRNMRDEAVKASNRDEWVTREYAAAKERMIESVRQGQDLKPLEEYVGRLEKQAAPVTPVKEPARDPIVAIADEEPKDMSAIPEDEIEPVDLTPDYTMDDLNAMVNDYVSTTNDPLKAANGTTRWAPSRDAAGRENGIHMYQMAKNVSIPSMADIEAIGTLRQMRAGRFATGLAQNSTDLWSLGTLYGFRFAQRSALEDLISFTLTAGLGRMPDLYRGRRASTALRDVSPTIRVVKKADMKDKGTGVEHAARRDLRRANTRLAKAQAAGDEAAISQAESAIRTAQATLDNDYVYIVPKNDPNLFFDRTSRLGMFNKWYRKMGDYAQARNIQFIQSVILPNIDVEKLAVAHAATTHGNYQPIRELIGETLGNQRFNKMSPDDVEFIKDLMGTPAGTAIFQDFAESAAKANSANFSGMSHAADELLDIPDIEFAKPGRGIYYGPYKSLRLSAKTIEGGIEDGAMMAWYRRLQAIVDDDGPIGKIAIAHLNNPEKAKKAIADAIRKDMAKKQGKWGYAERWSLMDEGVAIDDFANRYYEAVLPYFLKRDNTLNWDLRNKFVHSYVDKKGASKFKVSWTVSDEQGRNRYVLQYNDLSDIRPKDRPLYVLGREQSTIPMPKNEKALWSDRAWDWMGNQYARIAREPIFMANYLANRKALKPMQDQLAQMIAGEGKAISRTDELVARRMVDRQAHDAAYSFSLAYMDNPNNRSILAYKVRNFARYYRATEDFYRRAGRLAKNYPDAYWKIALTYQVLDDTGWTYRDENGDLYFAYPGNQFLQDAISTISGPFLGGSAGIGSIVDPFQLGGKLKSIAPSTDPSQWLVTPSGPIGTIPLTLLFNKFPEMQGVRSVALGQYSQAGQTGNLAGELLDTILPAGAQRFWNNLGPDERDASIAGAMTGALAISMSNGTFDSVNPNEMTIEQLKNNDVYGEVSKSAWSTLITKMFLGYAAPASPQMYQNSVTDFGRELGISGMNEVWRKLIDKHEGDFNAAFADWQKIDPTGDLLPFTVSKTKDNPDLLAGLTKAKPYKEVVEWARTSEAKDLANKYPDSYLFLAPQVGEFTWDGWALLKGLGLKVGKDTDAIAIDMFAAKGEREDAAIRAMYDTEIQKYDRNTEEGRKQINALETQKSDARSDVEKKNPYWAAKRAEIRQPYMGDRIVKQFNESVQMLDYLQTKNGELDGTAALMSVANSVWLDYNTQKAGFSSSTDAGQQSRRDITSRMEAELASIGAEDPAVASYIETILMNLDYGSL